MPVFFLNTPVKCCDFSRFKSVICVVSGWRRGPAGSSARCVRRASAERRSSRCTAEAAPAKKTPGTDRVFGSVLVSGLLCDRVSVVQVENSTSTPGTEDRA